MEYSQTKIKAFIKVSASNNLYMSFNWENGDGSLNDACLFEFKKKRKMDECKLEAINKWIECVKDESQSVEIETLKGIKVKLGDFDILMTEKAHLDLFTNHWPKNGIYIILDGEYYEFPNSKLFIHEVFEMDFDY